jgi:hypothetical protein
MPHLTGRHHEPGRGFHSGPVFLRLDRQGGFDQIREELLLTVFPTKQLPADGFSVHPFQDVNARFRQARLRRAIHSKRNTEKLIDRSGMVIGCDSVDGEATALHALMDEQQFAGAWAILLGRPLESQPDRLHAGLARRQAVTGRVQIEVPGP